MFPWHKRPIMVTQCFSFYRRSAVENNAAEQRPAEEESSPAYVELECSCQEEVTWNEKQSKFVKNESILETFLWPQGLVFKVSDQVKSGRGKQGSLLKHWLGHVDWVIITTLRSIRSCEEANRRWWVGLGERLCDDELTPANLNAFVGHDRRTIVMTGSVSDLVKGRWKSSLCSATETS